MITCTSDRSGMASSGVRARANRPKATSMAVISSTRKRLWIDQRMMCAIMDIFPVQKLEPVSKINEQIKTKPPPPGGGGGGGGGGVEMRNKETQPRVQHDFPLPLTHSREG